MPQDKHGHLRPPRGETPLANVNADARLWPHVLGFLANPAGQTGTFTAPATPPPLTTS